MIWLTTFYRTAYYINVKGSLFKLDRPLTEAKDIIFEFDLELNDYNIYEFEDKSWKELWDQTSWDTPFNYISVGNVIYDEVIPGGVFAKINLIDEGNKNEDTTEHD